MFGPTRKVVYGLFAISAAGLLVLKIWQSHGDEEWDTRLKEQTKRCVSKADFLAQVKESTSLSSNEAKMYWKRLDPLHKGVLTLAELSVALRSLYYEFNPRHVNALMQLVQDQFQSSPIKAIRLSPSKTRQAIGSYLISTGKRVQEFAAGTRNEMQDSIHRTVRRYLARALDIMAAQLKMALKDDDMPVYLQVGGMIWCDE